MRLAKLVIQYFNRLNELSTKRVEDFGAQYEIFGSFAVINYIIPYFMWSPSTTDNYILLIYLRLIAGILCFLLIIKDRWRKIFAPYLPLYWHVTLVYCLPFLTTFMLFDSEGDTFWLLNLILAAFFLAVLVDWRSFIAILILGVSFGYGFFILINGVQKFSLAPETIYWTTYMCFFSVLIGFLFSRRNEKIAEERLGAYKIVSTSIAHEMRTPLSSMYISAQGVAELLPCLLSAYEIAEKNGLDIPKVSPKKLEILKEFPDHFISISRRSLSIIDIFLTQFGALEKRTFSMEKLSVQECLSRTLSEYPFVSDKQKSLINLDNKIDFIFSGNDYLIIHVFSNLIKNALYQIQTSQKGAIDIWASKHARYNIVHFRDGATGIKPADITKIFDKFYSDTFGTGIGLSFCQWTMNALGGKITCHSTFGEYTEFQLYFPKHAL